MGSYYNRRIDLQMEQIAGIVTWGFHALLIFALLRTVLDATINLHLDSAGFAYLILEAL